MSWLQTHKAKFDEAAAKKVAADKKEKDYAEATWASAKRELQAYAQQTLGDLAGRKTKDGERLSIEWDKTYNQVQLIAGEKPLLQLRFSVYEHEDGDSDGCKWGNGEYYTKKQVQYYRKHEDRSGYNKGGDGLLNELYDEDLAYYLLLFVDV